MKSLAMEGDMNYRQWEHRMDDRECLRQIRKRDKTDAWIAWGVSVGAMLILAATAALLAVLFGK